MAIAEPFCKTYKPSVRADRSCYWEEEPTSTSTIQECGATEEGTNIIYQDNKFREVKKEASVVTEFNLVNILYMYIVYCGDVFVLLIPTLLRFANVTSGGLCGRASQREVLILILIF